MQSKRVAVEKSIFQLLVNAFQWDGQLTRDMQESYDSNGFFVARDFMDEKEVSQILKVLEEPDGILKYSYTSYERNGRGVIETLCMRPGYDVTGMVARSEKLVDMCEKIMRTELYHWCSLFVIKEAKIGGQIVWHQDYGYWYDDGCIYPDMITVWIALDDCTRKSGCKQVFRGSHKTGRINHDKEYSGQTGADLVRTEQIRQHCEKIYLEMKPGDAFIHHSNLLHKSGENVSDHTRRAFMSCYNAAYNSPVEKTHYPSYVKIDKVKDSAIKECTNYTDFSGKVFSKEV